LPATGHRQAANLAILAIEKFIRLGKLIMAQFAAKKLQFAICNVTNDSPKNLKNNRL
jgi:hypothetical protein